MKFGLSVSATASDHPGEGVAAFERIAAWGFDGVELRIHGPLDFTHLRDMRGALTTLGLDVTVAGDDSPEPLETRLRELVDACAVLDAHVLCGSFALQASESDIAMLARAASYAASLGVELALGGRAENPAVTLTQICRLIDAVDAENLGLSYNTYQAHVDEPSISSAVLAAGARLRHVQIAENDGAAPGDGQVRWSETFAALDAIRYDGWYVIETRGTDDLDAIANRGLRFLERHRVTRAA